MGKKIKKNKGLKGGGEKMREGDMSEWLCGLRQTGTEIGDWQLAHSKPLVKCTQSNQEMAKWRIRKVKAQETSTCFMPKCLQELLKGRFSRIFIINRQRDVLIINRRQRFVRVFPPEFQEKKKSCGAQTTKSPRSSFNDVCVASENRDSSEPVNTVWASSAKNFLQHHPSWKLTQAPNSRPVVP